MLPCAVAARAVSVHEPLPYAESRSSLVRHPDPRRSRRCPHGHLRRGGHLPPPAGHRRRPRRARSPTPSTARWSTSRTARSSTARWSRSTRTRSCSTSATSPRASSPLASCRSATTSTRPRSCRSATRSRRSSSPKEDKEGRLVLSKKRAQYERAWGTIEKIKEADGVVEGPVIEVVKGGLILDIGLRGFLPASLVELRRVRDLQPYVGRSLQAKIIELDKNRNNVVLSRRACLEETQKEQREDFLANLKPGEVRKGVVSSVVNFGAFVDLGGMDGLIHVSELSWKHVDHPGSVVAVGDEVTVQVLDVDLDRERISLSLKATQQDPWQEFATTHRVGELVYGRVTKLVPFGAFVQVGDGIEGLVHISEMSAHHVDLPEQVVTPGEELWVKIIDLDLARRRISLSIKQAAEGGEVAEEYREHFGEHAFDDEGNYIGVADDAEREAAWAEYYAQYPDGEGSEGAPEAPEVAARAAAEAERRSADAAAEG